MRCENPCLLCDSSSPWSLASIRLKMDDIFGMPCKESVSTPMSANEGTGEEQLRNISSIERRSQTPLEDAKSRPVQVKSRMFREIQPENCPIQEQWIILLHCALQEDSYAHSTDQ